MEAGDSHGDTGEGYHTTHPMNIPHYSRDLKVRFATAEELHPCGEVGSKAFGKLMHPDYRTPDTTLVGEAPGKGIVCTLCLRPAPGWWGDAHVPMSSIGSVATLPGEQKHGYAGALMVQAIHILCEMGMAICPLWPFSFRYYRKFGWELGSLDWQITGPPSLFRSLGSSHGCRNADADDLPMIKAIYEAHARRHNACTVRPESWWPEKETLASTVLLHVGDDGEPDGYAHYRTNPRDQEDGSHLEIREFAVTRSEAEAPLAAGVAGIPNVSKLVLLLPSDSSLPLRLPERAGIQALQRLEIRVLDVARAVKCLRVDPQLRGTFRLEVSDWVMSAREPVSVTVSVQDGRVHCDSNSNPAPVLRTTIQEFSRIFTGLLAPTKAAEWGMLEAQDRDALLLADRIFHTRAPFRSWVEPG